MLDQPQRVILSFQDRSAASGSPVLATGHASTKRLKGFPHNVKMPSRPSNTHYGSSSSSSSSDSDVSTTSSTAQASGYRYSMDSVARPIASVEVLRCMRCARAVEATSTDDVSSTGMVRISHGLYYCERCAKMVGYT